MLVNASILAELNKLMNDILPLSDEEVRIVACIIEKSSTTPDQYPLTVNAIKVACNQKTNRNPVVNYDDNTVLDVLRSLHDKQLIIRRSMAGSRVAKYEHAFAKALAITQREVVVLCVLMLKGPLTSNEIRTSSQRQFEFDDLDEIKRIVNRLLNKEQPMAMELPRSAGQKEVRFGHLLTGVAPEILPTPAKAAAIHSEELSQRVEALESKVAELEKFVEDLTN